MYSTLFEKNLMKALMLKALEPISTKYFND